MLIVDTYPQISDPVTVLRHVAESLAPTGRVGIVDFRKDGAGGPGPPLADRIDPEIIRDHAKQAGLVLVRQRPGSAKGVIFMTIEDETGVANAIVWPKVFTTYRPVVMGARLVKIRGRLQRESSVIHVVAEHIEDITPMLGLLRAEVRRFGANDRADETLRPTGDAREKKAQGDLRLAMARRSGSSPEQTTAEVADVMPKGRNFH